MLISWSPFVGMFYRPRKTVGPIPLREISSLRFAESQAWSWLFCGMKRLLGHCDRPSGQRRIHRRARCRGLPRIVRDALMRLPLPVSTRMIGIVVRHRVLCLPRRTPAQLV